MNIIGCDMIKKLSIVFILAMLGCEEPDTSNKIQNFNSAPPPPPQYVASDNTYDVDTMTSKYEIDEEDCHKYLVKWIKEHPERRIVSVVPYVHRFGCRGISVISTSTK